MLNTQIPKRRTLILHGALAEQYGRKHQFHANTVKGLVEGVDASIPGLKDAIFTEEKFGVFINELKIESAMDQTDVWMTLSDDEHTIHIYPVIEGDRSGLGKLVLGIALIGISIAMPGSGIAFANVTWASLSSTAMSMGASMALAGAMMHFADTPTNTDDDGQSIFSQGQNISFEGAVLPLWYGLCKAQGVLVDYSIMTDVVGRRIGHGGIEWDDIDNKAELRAKMVFAVSHGECDGPAITGSSMPTQKQIEESVLIKGVPVHGAFENSYVGYRKGSANQSIVGGFETSSTLETVNVTLNSGAGITRTIDADIDAVRLNISWPEGMYYMKDNGGLHGSTSGFNIHVNTGNGFELYDVRTQQVTSTTPFVATYEVVRPAGSTGTWQVRLTRLEQSVEEITTRYVSSGAISTNTYNKTIYPEHESKPENNNESGHFNEFKWDSLISIKGNGSSYPGTALYAIDVSSEDVDNVISDIAFVGRGRDIWMAHNYNPNTRTHSGSFNGSLKQAYSNNPAYVLLDLMYDDDTYGGIIDKSLIDLPAFYRAALWCDAQGFEFNGQLMKANNAVQLMNSVASTFLGKLVQAVDGKVSLTWAGESNSATTNITNDMVVEGRFKYISGNINTQTTSVSAKWQNPAEDYDTTTVVEDDSAAIASRGVIPLSIEVPGITSEAHARTIARYNLRTNSKSLRTIEWVGSWAHANITSGDVVNIVDDLNDITTKVKVFDTELTSPEQGLYTFKAIEFDDGLYEIATGTASGEDNPTNNNDGFTYNPLPSSTDKTISAVIGLTAREVNATIDNAIKTASLMVEWQVPAVGASLINHYEIQHRYNDGVVTDQYISAGSPFTIKNTLVGLHEIIVRGVSNQKNKGTVSSIVYEIRDTNVSGDAVSAGAVYVAGTTGTVFLDRDLVIEWANNNNVQNLSHYEVEFMTTNNVLMKQVRVEKNSGVNNKNQATLLYADNYATSSNGGGIGGPQRSVKCYVYAVDTAGRRSAPSFATMNNSRPPAVSGLAVETRLESALFSFNLGTDPDIAGYKVARAINGTNNYDIIYDGLNNKGTVGGLADNTIYKYRVAAYDFFDPDDYIWSNDVVAESTGTINTFDQFTFDGLNFSKGGSGGSNQTFDFTVDNAVNANDNFIRVDQTLTNFAIPSSGTIIVRFTGDTTDTAITYTSHDSRHFYFANIIGNTIPAGGDVYVTVSTGGGTAENTIQWTSGTAYITNSAGGNPDSFPIAAGSTSWTAGTLWIYYVKGGSTLLVTNNADTAIKSNTRLMAIYRGGNDIIEADGNGTLRDGNFIYDGSITASKMEVGLIKSDSLLVDTAAIGSLMVAGNAITTTIVGSSSTAHALSYTKGSSNGSTWIHKFDTGDTFLHELHGYHYNTSSGWNDGSYDTRPVSDYVRASYDGTAIQNDFPVLTVNTPAALAGEMIDVIVQVTFELGTSTKSNNKYCKIQPQLEYWYPGLSSAGVKVDIGNDAHNSSLSGGIPFIKSFVGIAKLSVPGNSQFKVSLATTQMGTNPQVYGANTTDWLGLVYNYVLIRNIDFVVTMYLR